MKLIFIALIKFYKIALSPVVSRKMRCRFYPTCSVYAVMAFNKYGVKTGIKLTVARLCKCNPYNGDSCIDYP
jgi:putative membrane protein insertion efficiency factor